MTNGPNELVGEVLEQERCSGCGMCVALCPNIISVRERVAVIRDCGLSEGLCYAACPATETDISKLENAVFGRDDADPVLGHYVRIAMSQAEERSVQRAGQYGGTVTALAALALEQGLVDAVLLTQQLDGASYAARGVFARTPDEVLACAGSKYTACPSLSSLDEIERNGLERVAVVGRPCQVRAIRKLQHADIEPEIAAKLRESIKLVIGVFCIWALDYRAFINYLRETVGSTKLDRIDIPKDKAVIVQDGKETEVPYDSLKECRLAVCDQCEDMTAELADLSVGSTEWKDDWNTLIVRSEAGQALVESATAAGGLKIQDLPDERIEMLVEAVKGKKARAQSQANVVT